MYEMLTQYRGKFVIVRVDGHPYPMLGTVEELTLDAIALRLYSDGKPEGLAILPLDRVNGVMTEGPQINEARFEFMWQGGDDDACVPV